MCGLSNLQFIFILIIGFLLLSFLVLALKLGLFSKIRFKHHSFPESRIIYTIYEGPYDLINNKCSEVMADMGDILKFSTLFAIYYDNPA